MGPVTCVCTAKLLKNDHILSGCQPEHSGEHTRLGLTWMSLGSGSHHRPTRPFCDAWSSPWTVCCPKTPTWCPVAVCLVRTVSLVLLYCCVQTAVVTVGRPFVQVDDPTSRTILLLTQICGCKASVVVSNKWAGPSFVMPRWHPKQMQWL